MAWMIELLVMLLAAALFIFIARGYHRKKSGLED
jgi:hypothetical protein